MRAVVIRETGDPDVLRVEDVEDPEPADGEVLIAVRAASINPIDWKYRRGFVETALPTVLGIDVSGVVATSRDDRVNEGDEVLGAVTSCGYAERGTARAATIAAKPDGISHQQAAARP